MKKLLSIFAVLVALSACTATDTATKTGDANSKEKVAIDEPVDADSTDNSLTTEKNMTINQTDLPQSGDKIAIMKTSKGTIKIRLFEKQTPKTVANFIGLAEKDYYNGVIFHLVIPNFMIQGGDPTGTGRGGESFLGGMFENEPVKGLSNIRGAISMANAGKDTNGSQFFINQKDNINLDGYENGKLKDCSIYGVSCHTVFGQVFEGMDVVDEIANVETGPQDKPLQEIKIESVTIETQS